MHNKLNLLWLLAVLIGATAVTGCPALTGDDDDSATDDDDSAEGTTCDTLQAAFEACSVIGGWDVGDVDFCTLQDDVDAADLDAWLGCSEGALMALECSAVDSAEAATAALNAHMFMTAGCEDFAEAPGMTLDAIEIECSEEAGPGAVHSAWNVELNVMPGWATDISLFMWDGNTFDATWANDVHYVDSWLPLTDWDNTESGDFSAFDVWSIDFSGYDNFGDAETEGGTFLKCVDSAGVPQIENRDFMVCGTDFTYEDVSECWYCGNFFGEGAGTNSVDYGTVGAFDNGTDAWEATVEFSDTASAKYPCFYTVL